MVCMCGHEDFDHFARTGQCMHCVTCTAFTRPGEAEVHSMRTSDPETIRSGAALAVDIVRNLLEHESSSVRAEPELATVALSLMGQLISQVIRENHMDPEQFYRWIFHVAEHYVETKDEDA